MDDLKEFSEQEVLLSDQDNIPIANDNIDKDPLVDAMMSHHKNHIDNKNKDNINKDNVVDNGNQDEKISLIQNSFSIPANSDSITCGISWLFQNDNKIIDLDLIVTALDIHSFEMDSVSKDHKKIFKKSIISNKNNKKKNFGYDKSIQLKLTSIPDNCHSLWFIINAYSGDSLKDVDKATFDIYTPNDDDDDDDDDDDNNDNNPNNILYSYDIGMGYDCGALLLGVLYRDSLNNNNNNWIWTIIEERNVYADLIKNNLKLIYNDKILSERPNDKNIKATLDAENNDQYIIDPNIDKISLGIGWEFASPFSDINKGNDNDNNDDLNELKPNINNKKIKGYDIDIDVDGSIIVFGKITKTKHDNKDKDNDKQLLKGDKALNNGKDDDDDDGDYEYEYDCEQIDIVRRSNGFYKTYVQHIKVIDNNDVNNNNNDNDNDNDEQLGRINNNGKNNNDDELFDIYLNKMNGDSNDIGSLCIILNIFNDNNNKNTNNISSCYTRIIDKTNRDNVSELCRVTLKNINNDNKTCAFVLGFLKRLNNGCWSFYTNNIPYKAYHKMDYQTYAKEIILNTFKPNTKKSGKCCTIL